MFKVVHFSGPYTDDVSFKLAGSERDIRSNTDFVVET